MIQSTYCHTCHALELFENGPSAKVVERLLEAEAVIVRVTLACGHEKNVVTVLKESE